MLMRQSVTIKSDEKGFASIVIALILIIILALTTIGFSQLARREQQDSLNKQLANQAYYAAETGINDIIKILPALQSPANAATMAANKYKCPDLTVAPYNLNPDIDTTNGVSYTCAMINLEPSSLNYTGVSPNTSRSVTFSTTSNLNTLTIRWGSKNGNNTPRPSSGFTSLSTWSAGNSPAVLQSSLTRLSTMTRDSLISNTFHTYLFPQNGGSGTIAYNTAQTSKAAIGSSACTGGGAYPCSVTITGIGGAANEYYLLHLEDFYEVSNIQIDGKDASGNPVNFVNGQVQIDVTGHAKDVLKRLQVRVPLAKTWGAEAIQAQSICKRFSTSPGSTLYDSSDPSCTLSP